MVRPGLFLSMVRPGLFLHGAARAVPERAAPGLIRWFGGAGDGLYCRAPPLAWKIRRKRLDFSGLGTLKVLGISCCPIFGDKRGNGRRFKLSAPPKVFKMYPINWTRKFLFYTHKSWIPQSCGHTSCKFIATTPLFWWLVPFLHRMYIHISFPFHRWCDIVISMKWRKTL